MHHPRNLAAFTVRMAILTLVLVVGHDVLMTANVHDQRDAHAEHVVQQCGPTEGALAQAPLLPTMHAPAAFIASLSMTVLHPLAHDAADQIEVVADASARRAMLQVFLN